MSERITKHKKIKGIKKHGFLSKMKTHGGRTVIRKRRLKGRKKLAQSL
ncbi:MAG: 50S ribosomal protein L34 [Candidatus Levyibacteriota bacterium]